MKPVNFHQKEIIYNHPDPNILDLPVLQVQYSNGNIGLISCWKPSWKDRLRILFGKPIYAGLLSPVQPPIFISTKNEIDEDETLELMPASVLIALQKVRQTLRRNNADNRPSPGPTQGPEANQM